MRSNRELVDYLIRQGYLKSEKVVMAFLEVDRKDFVPERYKEFSYIDEPLPIGYGQTISAPSIVALMTELLELEEGEKVLEVGAGSGYQAAIISRIVGEKGNVITVERIPEVFETARKNLSKYKNVKVILGDGSIGCPREAPFDKIIVTACAPRIPEPLIEQLKDGGIMVIPVGGNTLMQRLYRVKKISGELKMEFIEYVSFVPLIGKYGFS